MGNITEILGEKKYSTAQNKSLKFKLSMVKPDQLDNEGVKFTNVVSDAQYELEKRQSTKYKAFGKLSVDVSLDYYQPLSRRPNRSDFEPNESNWQFMMLRPVPVFDAEGNKFKGVKKITFTYRGNSYSFDFQKGLPLFRVSPWSNRNRSFIGFISVLNHNFVEGQVINLTGLNEYSDISDGNYRIVNVDGKKFYVNAIQPNTTDINFVNDVDINESVDSEISKLYSNQPVIYGSKVVDGQHCEYYVKKLRTISDITNEISNCAYSRDVWGNQVYTYQQQSSIDVVGQLDNLDRPVIDLYFGAFKKSVSDNFVFTSVDSNFKTLISKTKNGSGIEKIYENVDETLNPPAINKYTPIRADNSDLFTSELNNDVFKPIVGDVRILPDELQVADDQEITNRVYSEIERDVEKISYRVSDIEVGSEFMSELVEYNPVNLREVVIHDIWHTFQFTSGTNRHRFSYHPFKRIRLKTESTYVESSVSRDSSPDYAKYNDKFQTYRWRDILDNGYYEDNGNGIDHIYFNGASYLQPDVLIQVVNYSSSVYDLVSGEKLTTRADSIIGDEFDNIDDVDNNTFEQYKGIKC